MKQFSEDFKRDLALIFNDKVGFEFHLTRLEAFALICQVQLADRHVLNIGSTRLIAEGAARRLQARLELTPALAEVLERGWKLGSDQKVE